MTPLEIFIKQFDLVENENQGVGCAVDAWNADGEAYEFKEDHAAAETGNFFLELSQTFDGGNTRHFSGLALAVRNDQSQYYVIFIGRRAYVFECPVLAQWVRLHWEKFQLKETRCAVNGNRVGACAKGLLVPVQVLSPYALHIYDLRPGLSGERWLEKKRLRALVGLLH